MNRQKFNSLKMVKIEKRTLSLIEFKFGGNQNVESGVFKLFSSVRFINEI